MSSPVGLVLPAAREQWLLAAQAGFTDELGRLLESFRHYLLLVANEEVDPALAVKVAPSDLVQETFLKAWREFAQFRGQTEEEFQGWLRRILLNTLVSFSRHYEAADKRQIAREVAPRAGSPGELQAGLSDPADSPSSQAVARERDQALLRALAQLPGPSRQVIQWRNYDLLSFGEIGQRLGRSAEAARKLWTRALEHLHQLLEPGHESR